LYNYTVDRLAVQGTSLKTFYTTPFTRNGRKAPCFSYGDILYTFDWKYDRINKKLFDREALFISRSRKKSDASCAYGEQ